MSHSDEALAVERAFFSALLAADTAALTALLTEDFVLVDVMRGGLVSAGMLRDALASGQLRFTAIEAVEAKARTYGDAAIVVGRTQMRGLAQGQAWQVESRYTHVFVLEGGRWRLASAQGTPIAPDGPVDAAP